MKNEIKRMAQLLFDNAAFFARELKRTKNYRAIKVDFSHHKKPGDTKKVEFLLYDEKGKFETLEDEQIGIARIKELAKKMNRDTGALPHPKKIKIRESLK